MTTTTSCTRFDELHRLLAAGPDAFTLLERTTRRHLLLRGVDADPVDLTSDEHGATVTLLHTSADHPGQSGVVTLTADGTEPAPILAARLAAARSAAPLCLRPAQHLLPPDAPRPAPPADLWDEASAADPAAATRRVLRSIESALAASGRLTLAGAEIDLAVIETRLRSSAGLDLTSRETLWILYLVVLADRPEGPFDHRLELRRRLASQVDPAALSLRLEHCEAAPGSGPPPSGPTTLALRGPQLAKLFQCLAHEASAEAVVRGLARLAPGAPVAPDAPAWLTVRLDGARPGGVAAHDFDADGVPGTTVTLVEGGRLAARTCPLAHAARLGLAPTGEPGDLVVPPPPDAPATADLLTSRGPVLFVDEFSDLAVNELSGDFSGEIRTGRLFAAGTVRRVGGGAVAGNLPALLPSLRLSRETVDEGTYEGAALLTLDGVTVVGGSQPA